MQAFKRNNTTAITTFRWFCPSKWNLFLSTRELKTHRKRKPDKEVRSESAWVRVRQSIHIEDPSVVSVLMTHLSADLGKPDPVTHLLEACPGKALLTEAILRQTNCTVVALADRRSSLSRLKVNIFCLKVVTFPIDRHNTNECLLHKELQNEFGFNRLHVHSFNTSLFKHMIVNAGEENAIGRIMRQLPSGSWTEPQVASMIVPLTPISETSFLRSLFLQIANMSAFFCNGRINFYAFISGRELYYMTASSDEKNLNRSVYMKLFFILSEKSSS